MEISPKLLQSYQDQKHSIYSMYTVLYFAAMHYPASVLPIWIYMSNNLARQRGLLIGRDASAAVFEGDAEDMELADSFWAV